MSGGHLDDHLGGLIGLFGVKILNHRSEYDVILFHYPKTYIDKHMPLSVE